MRVARNIKILVTDPAPMRRDSRVAQLSRAPGLNITGSGCDIVSALTDCEQPVRPNILLMTAISPQMERTETWATYHLLLPRVSVIALIEEERNLLLRRLLSAGVHGLHHVSVETPRLCRAIHAVARGLLDYDPRLFDLAKGALLGCLEDCRLPIGDLMIDLNESSIRREGINLHMTLLEFRLVAYLAQNRGRVISWAELLEVVWGTPPSAGGTIDQVKSCVKRIRKKLEADSRNPTYIRSIRNEGYIFADLP